VAARHECRRDAGFDAVVRAARQRDELEPPAAFGRERNVFGRDRDDAAAREFGRGHRTAERQRCEDREFVRGIEALDVVARIRFGEAALLRLRQRRRVARAAFHLREHEVGRAVDHAADLEDRLVGKRGFQGAQDWDRPADRRFIVKRRAGSRGERAQPWSVLRDQLLIGGDDVLAVRDRAQHEFARQAHAADALHHDAHAGIIDHRERVPVPGGPIDVS
jgi:hypothetical protein